MIKVVTSVILTVLMMAGIASAAGLNARGKKEMQLIETVVQQNLAASNAEDVDAVMDTMTPYTPNRETFVKELKQFFDEVDVYARLISVDFVSAEMTEYGQTVTVKVVQETLAGGEDDKDLPYSEFRSRSAMLPPWELCEFELVLHKVRGKWKAHLMGGNVREVTREELQAGPACQDGSCRLTNAGAR
jgi:ketosteroid isomerase-like protein